MLAVWFLSAVPPVAGPVHPAMPASSLPLGLPPFGQPFDDPALVDLGEDLFQTPLLSRDRTIACASCHVPALGFSGPAPVAVGVGGAAGTRHPPPLLNLYAATRLMLDGRAAGIGDQVHMPLDAPAEMDVDWPASLQALDGRETIRQDLAAIREPVLTKEIVLKALAAYVRSLVSGDSPFDRYFYGNDAAAISGQAQEGLSLFVRKGRCSGCHLLTGYSAPLTDGAFHAVGVGFADGAYKDAGRFMVTGAETDRGAFKTPTLRNVALRRHFMHDGSLHSLQEVLAFYNGGGRPGAPNQDGRIQPLHLSAGDIDAIIAFLRSLTSDVRSYRPDRPPRSEPVE